MGAMGGGGGMPAMNMGGGMGPMGMGPMGMGGGSMMDGMHSGPMGSGGHMGGGPMGGGKRLEPRPGDWDCPRCYNLNFSSRYLHQ